MISVFEEKNGIHALVTAAAWLLYAFAGPGVEAQDGASGVSFGSVQSVEARSGGSSSHGSDAVENLFSGDFNKLPTYIKSKSLNLKTDERVFVYSGDVEVKQGDMTLTCESLQGTYNENNQIEQLVAQKNVNIIKGENIRGSGSKAIFEAASQTVTLTDNPELQQNDSVLTADSIKIFLKENRSVAEGEVRVKLVNKNAQSDTKSLLAPVR